MPLIFHGCIAYYMIVETRDKINSRNPNVHHQANPSAGCSWGCFCSAIYNGGSCIGSGFGALSRAIMILVLNGKNGRDLC